MGFHWQKEAAMSGKEIAHLFPFRAKLMRAWKLLGSPSLESFCEAFEQWPFRRAMQQHNVSEDGQVRAVYRYGGFLLSDAMLFALFLSRTI